jgi:urea transporter
MPGESRVFVHLRAGLRGSGQILFQPSSATGVAFLLLVLAASPAAAALCVAGILGATLCASRLERNTEAYLEGAGGFNGALLGLALWAFVEWSWVLVPLAVVGGAATGLVRVGFLRRIPLPPLTAPYVIVGWIMVPICTAWLGAVAAEPHAGAVAEAVVEEAASASASAIGILNGASQVLFLAVPWIGVLVVVAVGLHSRSAAIWVGLSAVLSWLMAIGCGLEPNLVASGLLGYNAMILASALELRRTPWPLAIAGVAGTVVLTSAALALGAVPLSAPFVVTAWIVFAIEPVCRRRVPDAPVASAPDSVA